MKYNKIHFVGIKGVGMTPLAIIAHEAGCSVTGSDVPDEYITDKALKSLEIPVYTNFSGDHITDVDLVIATGAHGGLMNPEVVAAKTKNIPVLMQGQAVGIFMEGKIFEKNYTGVSVAGSHGKTTTTAMIATILKENKKDPTYVIGTSDVTSLGLPGHFGKGEVFVAEADEYVTDPVQDKTAKFLWQHPKIIVLTNIELDHPDIYASVTDVRRVFLQFVRQLPSDGTLIVCGDNEQIRMLLSEYSGKVITYGFGSDNDYVVKRVSISGPQTFFWLEKQGESLGEVALRVIGEHNALNATAAIITAEVLGLSLDEAKKGIIAFTGTKRRLEIIGTTRHGAILFDDYAHHPTEIQTSIKALKASYPDKKITVIFQPHTYSRTKVLFHEFVTAFREADTLLLMDIYASAREAVDPTISSALLSEEIKKTYQKVIHTPTQNNVLQYLTIHQPTVSDVVVTMGAGDVYKIGPDLQ